MIIEIPQSDVYQGSQNFLTITNPTHWSNDSLLSQLALQIIVILSGDDTHD